MWNLYNLVNDADQITNVADQHPDIIQKMKTAYEKYATDVGVIIPRGKAFADAMAGARRERRIGRAAGRVFAPAHPTAGAYPEGLARSVAVRSEVPPQPAGFDRRHRVAVGRFCAVGLR